MLDASGGGAPGADEGGDFIGAEAYAGCQAHVISGSWPSS
jgi:hypothetical protein